MGFRILIADDETAARARLRRMLTTEEPEIASIRECRDGAEVLTALKEETFDVAFLDIQMPGQTGLEVAERVALAGGPAIIFVTAFEQHALSAFGLGATDYLLKPFTAERLKTALTRVKARSQAVANAAPAAIEKPAGDARMLRVLVRESGRTVVVPAGNIDWIESAGNYAVLHAGRDNHVVRETLAELEARLAQGQFFRVSRMAVVNLDRVREVRSDGQGGHSLVLGDGTQVPITRPLREVQQRLEEG